MMENWLTAVNNLDTLGLLFLLFSAFLAGFIDAVVGGGGLIQLPALLIQFPQTAVPVILGTNKIAALTGTRCITLAVFPPEGSSRTLVSFTR